MKRLWIKLCISTMCVYLVLACAATTAQAEVRLIARLKTAGISSDKSGLKEQLEDGTSLSQLGGWSAIAATDVADEFWLLPDRGPKDGAVSYPTRIHKIRLKFDIQTESTIQFEIIETVMLKNGDGQSLIGLSSAFTSPNAATNLRFDPEGVRVIGKDRIAISDEYGPSVVVFNTKSGKALKWFDTPKYLVPKFLSGDPEQEVSENQTGRQANGGFEGLALQPDSNTLLAFTQKPALQDLQKSEDGKLVGSLCRVVEFSMEGESRREFLYPLESSSTAVSEILGLGKSQALVLERDSAAGKDAKYKGVFLIDYSNATNSQAIASVAPDKTSNDVKPAIKKPFINFLKEKFELAGDTFPAKPEGLTFGPNLPDGSRTLIVSVDNDFEPQKDSEIWVFSFLDKDLPTP